MTEIKYAKRLILMRDRETVQPSLEELAEARVRTFTQAEHYREARARMPVKRKPRPVYSEKAKARCAKMTGEEMLARIQATGIPVARVLAFAGIETSTFYRWVKEEGGTRKPHAGTLVTLHRALRKIERALAKAQNNGGETSQD